MSFDAIKWARDQRTGSPVAKAVLAAIATYADDEGKAWPSQQQLALDTEFSVRAVQDAMSILERRKLIYRCPRYAAGGGRLVDIIVLSIPARPAGLRLSKHASGAEHTGTSCLRTTNRELPEEWSANALPKRARPTPVSKTAGIKEAVGAWNSLADTCGLARIVRLTAARRQTLAARLRDCDGLDGWTAALELVRQSEFLTGGGNRGWRATFDWLLKQANFVKLLEGTYANRPQLSGRMPGGSSANVVHLAREIAAKIKARGGQ
jgi:hypothetical protein